MSTQNIKATTHLTTLFKLKILSICSIVVKVEFMKDHHLLIGMKNNSADSRQLIKAGRATATLLIVNLYTHVCLQGVR
jgi:hypothetical protein